MYFIDWIIGRCNDIASYFYSIYLDVYNWPYPFWLAASHFYNLSSLFNNLAWDFYNFGLWVDGVAAQVSQILSWSTIQSYILNWLYWIGDLSTLFYYFWTNVTNVINNWWASTWQDLLRWISTAQSFLQGQIENLSIWLSELQTAWEGFEGKIPSIDGIIAWFTDWWSSVLTQIIAWGALDKFQILGLISSAIRQFEPFWAGWQDWRDSIIEFIQDPWQWLYDRAEELFDRFW